MNYQELLQLIDKLDQSTVAYVEFSQGNEKVVLAKDIPNRIEQTASKKQTVITDTLSNIESNPNHQEYQNNIEETNASNTQGEAVLSPLVGVAYLQPKPDADAFVKIGDTVKKGDVLCIVEAMKLMNDIVSPFDGVITEILIENEMVVEFNQPLFKINQR